jgi:palmitoyl transferase
MRTLATTRSFCTATFLSLTLLLSPSSRADDGASAAQTPSDDARLDLYFSGYAWHNRNTYTDRQLKKLNEKAWGGGIGRSTRDERGNEGSWYAIGIRDSNLRPQWMAGYAHQWIFPGKPGNGPELGLGLTALVIRRHDWHDGRPFPALLPVVSVGTRTARLVATYVPHVTDGKKRKGDVVLVMFKLSL